MMNIPLPDALKVFVDQQASMRGYGANSEHVRELIRKDQDIQYLREMLLDGGSSPATAGVDAGYFQCLRDRVPFSFVPVPENASSGNEGNRITAP